MRNQLRNTPYKTTCGAAAATPCTGTCLEAPMGHTTSCPKHPGGHNTQQQPTTTTTVKDSHKPQHMGRCQAAMKQMVGTCCLCSRLVLTALAPPAAPSPSRSASPSPRRGTSFALLARPLIVAVCLSPPLVIPGRQQHQQQQNKHIVSICNCVSP